MRLMILACAALVLAACASTPIYAPATGPQASGYSHVRIEDNRYFVTYRAKSGANARVIEDFALLRAAELTLETGADWFIVDRRELDEDAPSTGPRVGVSVGGADYGRHSGVGVGVGMSFPLGGSEPRAHSATLEIRTGNGEKPDEANAYLASAVALSLRRQLQAEQ